MTTTPKLRVARPTANLAAVLPFYIDGLGMKKLFEFENHDGFDGAMVGAPGCPYHFEFTVMRGHSAARAPSEENLLVFYHPDDAEWSAAVGQMKAAGFATTLSLNPYWDRVGSTFEDADGYRVVLANERWDR